MTLHHLAQINVALPLYPLDDPRMREFVDALASVNAQAEGSPGFVWRLQDESGSAVDIRDEKQSDLLINMSIWTSIDSLHAYVYRSIHSDYLGDRKRWFRHVPQATSALWWIPAGEIPSVAQGLDRLDTLRRVGPSEAAFTFRTRFDPTGANISRT